MMRVQHFYHQVTLTFTYVVSDAETGVAAIIDPVLDLDYASGNLGTRSANEVVEHIRDHNLSLRYIREAHTPACMAYLIGDALFVGDTLFMPGAGTARCDFPGGDAKSLYESCQRLLALPSDTRVLRCQP